MSRGGWDRDAVGVMGQDKTPPGVVETEKRRVEGYSWTLCHVQERKNQAIESEISVCQLPTR